MKNHKHTKLAQPADQAAVIHANSILTPATGNQVPNAAVAANAAPSNHTPQGVVLSSRELKKLRTYLHQRLSRKVGVGLFDAILGVAAFAMLDDIQGSKGKPGKITRAQLFDGEGSPTEIARRYIEAVLDVTFCDGIKDECNLGLDLMLTFDEKILLYYEAQWAFQKSEREETAKRSSSAKGGPGARTISFSA